MKLYKAQIFPSPLHCIISAHPNSSEKFESAETFRSHIHSNMASMRGQLHSNTERTEYHYKLSELSEREDNEPRPSRGSLTMSWAISATRWFSYIKYFYPWTSSSSCRSLCACLLRFCYSLDPQSMPCFFLRKPAKEGWKFVSFYNINVVRICLRRNHDVLKPDGSCLTSQL